MTCRAIHFEALKDMTTQTTINTILRRWKFGPPATNNWGGIYERMVWSTKKHLTILLKKEALDSDIFITVLGGMESMLNNRRLTYASADSRDPEVLTPFNFVCPGVTVGSTVHVIPPVPPGDGNNLRNAWQKTRGLMDEFWRRWSEEYIAMLQSRSKWRTSSPNLRVGQMVLIQADDRPQDQWRLGIVDVLGAKGDGHVRQVTVRLANGKTFRCRCNALVGLEMD
jgi:hypothetical protein